MINSNNASLTFTRLPRQFGADILMAQVAISVEYGMPTMSLGQDAKVAVESSTYSVLYGDLMKLIENAKEFSLSSSFGVGQTYIQKAFDSVAGFEPRRIPVEVTNHQNSLSQLTVTGLSGITTWIPIDNEFATKTYYIKAAERELRWQQKAFLYEGLFDPLIHAQSTAMNFSRAGWQAVKSVFEPVFDGMMISISSANRVNYPLTAPTD